MAELNEYLQPLDAPVTTHDGVVGFDFDTDSDRGMVNSFQVRNASIGSAKIGTAAITTANIQDAAITNAKISSVSADKITAGTITVAVGVGTGNVTIDGANKRILINDGSNDRILIGYQSGGF